jgi:hypothetical protein
MLLLSALRTWKLSPDARQMLFKACLRLTPFLSAAG